MSYSTKDDILLQIDEETLINLTDDDDSGTIDDNVVNRAIADADALIDSYLSSRYAIPLLSAPAIIKNISVDIAIYNLYSRRTDTIPDIRKDRFTNALKYLQDITNGKIALQGGNIVSESIRVTTVKSDRAVTIGKESDGSIGTLDDY